MSSHAMLNIATKAAREAGRFIAHSAEKLDPKMIEYKATHDYVTEVDRRAEQHIMDILRDAFPDHQFLAEESSPTQKQSNDCDYLWIIDPLDGTTNFIHGIPQYAISIALEYRGKLEAGIIYDPIKHEEFTAVKGKGAQLNGKRIRVSTARNMEDAVIGTGFPFRQDQENLMDLYFDQAKRVAKSTAGIRRAGAASLDLAYVAAGRLDGFWEYGLQPWDIAAGILLVQEAGGLTSDPAGGHNFMKDGNIVCANPKIFKKLLQELNRKS